MPYTEITEITELDSILSAKTTCVINYGAKWCRSCVDYLPGYEAISNLEEYNGVKFYKVDLDKVDEAKDQYGITSIPLTVGYVEGEEEKRFIGNNADKLVDLLVSCIATIPTSPVGDT